MYDLVRLAIIMLLSGGGGSLLTFFITLPFKKSLAHTTALNKAVATISNYAEMYGNVIKENETLRHQNIDFQKQMHQCKKDLEAQILGFHKKVELLEKKIAIYEKK